MTDCKLLLLVGETETLCGYLFGGLLVGGLDGAEDFVALSDQHCLPATRPRFPAICHGGSDSGPFLSLSDFALGRSLSFQI